MTKKRLQQNVFWVILAFLSIPLVGILLKLPATPDDIYDIIKDFSALIIAGGAGYLAYCFQQRQSFLASLRELWREAVSAKGDLLVCTGDEGPSEHEIQQANRSLSAVIDLMRGVYKNVDESEAIIGLYPFEPLHDMRRVLWRVQDTALSPQQRAEERGHVLQAWNAFRWAFLGEFSTPYPSHPITSRGAADPRRKKSTSVAR